MTRSMTSLVTGRRSAYLTMVPSRLTAVSSSVPWLARPSPRSNAALRQARGCPRRPLARTRCGFSPGSFLAAGRGRPTPCPEFAKVRLHGSCCALTFLGRREHIRLLMLGDVPACASDMRLLRSSQAFRPDRKGIVRTETIHSRENLRPRACSTSARPAASAGPAEVAVMAAVRLSSHGQPGPGSRSRRACGRSPGLGVPDRRLAWRAGCAVRHHGMHGAAVVNERN